REAGFAMRHGVEHVLEVGPRARLPAEQRAEGAHDPAFGAVALRRHERRQIARLVGHGVGGIKTGVAVRHGGQASLNSRPSHGSGRLMRIMILLSSLSISSASASTE